MTMIEQRELNLINKTIMHGTLAHMDQYSTVDAVEPYNNDGENIVFYIEPLSTESYAIGDLHEEGLINDKYYYTHIPRAGNSHCAYFYLDISHNPVLLIPFHSISYG